ncbi:MAG TPA: hypothetical protein VH475_28380 [Tepidisphaeraceae bacterium]|jgi:hypothetical protein
MNTPEKLDLIRALCERTDLSLAGRQAFRQAHPDAPPEMTDTAAFHVYTDGVGAAIDWLADAERFLRDPTRPLDYGCTWHLIYHLYNWLQFTALLPVGRTGLLGKLAEIRKSLDEGDTESAKEELSDLESLFGDRAPPNIA